MLQRRFKQQRFDASLDSDTLIQRMYYTHYESNTRTTSLHLRLEAQRVERSRIAVARHVLGVLWADLLHETLKMLGRLRGHRNRKL